MPNLGLVELLIITIVCDLFAVGLTAAVTPDPRPQSSCPATSPVPNPRSPIPNP